MPVVRGRDRDGVDLLVVQQSPDILVLLDTFQFLRPPLQHPKIHIAQRRDPHPVQFAEFVQVRFAPAVQANDCDPDVAVGPSTRSNGALAPMAAATPAIADDLRKFLRVVALIIQRKRDFREDGSSSCIGA